MYLSRLELTLTDRRVQRLLADSYDCHRMLSLACAKSREAKPGRILYRLEPPTKNDAGACLLVQSEDEPEWVKPGVAENLPLVAVEKKEVHFEPVAGVRYNFRLRANPTVKREGKRRAVLKEEELLVWLERKLENGGARLLGVNVISEGALQVRRPGNGKRSNMLFHSVLFEGLLEATDSRCLSETLANGVGSAKAFGFGLLSLARAR